MNKRMKTMLIAVGVLFGAIFLFKSFKVWMIKRYISTHGAPAMTVSTTKAQLLPWQPTVTASASIRAVRGVNVTTELAGTVRDIYFTPGSFVTAGTLLVQLNADAEMAQLTALEANAVLAKITYDRDKAQYAARAISKQQLDTDDENLKNANAQVEQQKAVVAKKTVRAPFTGKLGISQVNPGQYINPGDPIVTLQTLDPIYVDFNVPQQELAVLKVGQAVQVVSDTFPNKKFTGKITTINPLVDQTTRNVEVEATVANPQSELVPGMFATITVETGAPIRYLTLPQTAVSFNPYGDIVFVVREKKNEDDEKILIAQQVFVITGETRGDQVVISKGIQPGDTVITSGQLKLKNGSTVIINNKIEPSAKAQLDLINEE